MKTMKEFLEEKMEVGEVTNLKEFLEEKMEVGEVTNLQKEVFEILIDEGESLGYDGDSVEAFSNEIIQQGCVSGVVGSLIYYNQTVEFYHNNEDDINEWFVETLQITGFENIFELIEKLDGEEDPLLITDQSKNWIVWAVFEGIVFDTLTEYEGVKDSE